MDNYLKILLADDHNIVLDGLSSLIDDISGVVVVAKCSNGKQVLNFLKEDSVDLILMDIDMPIISGLEATKIISKDYPNVKIIALSMYSKLSYVKKMMQYGAKGYLLKTTNKAEIEVAIDTIVNRDETFISPSLEKEILSSVFTENARSKGSLPVITKRERQVLELIAEEHTSAEIAEKLKISTNTVEFHRKNLLIKFDARNVVGLVKVAIQSGILS